MGWTTIPGSNRASLIKHLTRGYRPKNDGVENESQVNCIKHCYRGAIWQGLLWSVWERVHDFNGPQERWIRVDRLEWCRSDDGWGYKDMTESCGPYHYSCPLGYLELVPDDGINTGVHAGWRDGVIEYHRRSRDRRRSKRKAKECNGVELGQSRIGGRGSC